MITNNHVRVDIRLSWNLHQKEKEKKKTPIHYFLIELQADLQGKGKIPQEQSLAPLLILLPYETSTVYIALSTTVFLLGPTRERVW